MSSYDLTNADLTIADKLQVSTDGEYNVHGSGMFDDLMEAVNKHLGSQYKLARLQGSDYAKVYTASLQAAMSNAVQYLLGKKDADLIAQQVLKVKAEIEMVHAQRDKILAEIVLLEAKQETEAQQRLVLAEQVEMLKAQTKAFADSSKQKYLKTIIDGQAVNANIEGVGLVDHPFNQSNLTDVAAATKPY